MSVRITLLSMANMLLHRHVREYLSSESSDRGFRLLGDVLRAQNKREEALAAYEKSLQLNPQQENVLSAVCDLIPPEPANSSRLEVIILHFLSATVLIQ